MKDFKLLSNMIKELNDFGNNDISLKTFSEFTTLYTSNVLNFNHDTQRKKIWNIGKATKFIESILQEFPFQPIYLSENKDFHSVIDGKQRLITMLKFSGSFIDGNEVGDNTNIENSFALDKNFMNPDLLYLLNAGEEKIDYKFLVNKYEDFNSIFNNVIFPTYTFDNVNFSDGDEKGVYDVFNRLNSTGVPIENGDIYKSSFFSKLTELKIRNKFKEIVKNFKQSIMGNDDKILSKNKEWFLIFKLMWIYDNYNIAIRKGFNAKNIEDEISEYINKIDVKNFPRIMDLLSKTINFFMDIKNSLNNEYNNIGSIFNRNMNNSEPVNLWLNMYPWIMNIYSKKMKVPTLEDFKEIKKLINDINDGTDEFLVKEKNDEVIKLKNKFSREPQKITLILFSINKMYDKKGITNDEIANSIKNDLL